MVASTPFKWVRPVRILSRIGATCTGHNQEHPATEIVTITPLPACISAPYSALNKVSLWDPFCTCISPLNPVPVSIADSLSYDVWM